MGEKTKLWFRLLRSSNLFMNGWHWKYPVSIVQTKLQTMFYKGHGAYPPQPCLSPTLKPEQTMKLQTKTISWEVTVSFGIKCLRKSINISKRTFDSMLERFSCHQLYPKCAHFIWAIISEQKLGMNLCTNKPCWSQNITVNFSQNFPQNKEIQFCCVLIKRIWGLFGRTYVWSWMSSYFQNLCR